MEGGRGGEGRAYLNVGVHPPCSKVGFIGQGKVEAREVCLLDRVSMPTHCLTQ